MLTKTLLKQTHSAARKRFGRLPLTIWYAWHGDYSYRAYVINTKNRIVLYKGPIALSPKEAVRKVKEELSQELKKTCS